MTGATCYARRAYGLRPHLGMRLHGCKASSGGARGVHGKVIAGKGEITRGYQYQLLINSMRRSRRVTEASPQAIDRLLGSPAVEGMERGLRGMGTDVKGVWRV